MKKEKITVNDIAEYLGVSRNTVSKALNGQYVPARTRDKVLNAAIELGYKSYRTIASERIGSHRRIVLLSSKMLTTITYFIHILRSIESAVLDEDNIELLQFTATKNNFFDRFLDFLNENNVSGIICIELFQPTWISKLITLGYPIVFFDFPFSNSIYDGNFDVVLPESFNAVREFCIELVNKQKCKSFGFVGDYTHCMSFYERYLGMREACFLCGLKVKPEHSVIENDAFPYGNAERLAEIIKKMPSLPDCLVAANDTIAVSILSALESLKKKVPADVLVMGFDNLSESKKCNPPLTTFSVDKSLIGKKILSVLLDRVIDPGQRSQFIYLQSKPIIRQTT